MGRPATRAGAAHPRALRDNNADDGGPSHDFAVEVFTFLNSVYEGAERPAARAAGKGLTEPGAQEAADSTHVTRVVLRVPTWACRAQLVTALEDTGAAVREMALGAGTGFLCFQ